MSNEYSQNAFKEFLRRIDAELTAPTTIVVIGGAALSLAYLPNYATADLDLWGRGEAAFHEAAARVARSDSDLRIPYDVVTIATPPIDFEDRLIRLSLGFARLTVVVPEPHDWALLKTSRAEAHDLDALYALHQVRPFDLETLCDRYHEARTQVVGSLSTYQLNFLALIGRLFGDAAADALEASGRLEP
ncbi:MAG: hypothetical protein K1X64_16550 [Myxococcaceae bacterium]|nr:hypothetical protein [Myxococcaceae bacterium]